MVGRIEEAKKDLDQCIVLEPQNGEARTLLKKVTDKFEG
jgi:hypothetical protein